MPEIAELERTLAEVERTLAEARRDLDSQHTRVDFLERAMPSDRGGKPLLTGEGHAHAQSIEGRDGGTSQGFGYGLDATTALTLTRSGRIFTLTHQQVTTGDLHQDYLLADGTRALTANWDAGAFTITANGFRLNDNENFTFGTGADATIDYDGTNLVIVPNVVGTGGVLIDGVSDAVQLTVQAHSGGPNSKTFVVEDSGGIEKFSVRVGSTTHAVITGDTDGNAEGPLVLLPVTGTGANIGVSLTLDNRGATSGNIWSFISTGTTATGGAGDFAFFGGDSGQYRLRIFGNGNVAVADTVDHGEKFQVVGTSYFEGAVEATAAMTLTTATGIDYNPGSDIDTDIITVGVSGTPKFSWDESESVFTSTHEIHINLDNQALALGAKDGGDARIYWSGSQLAVDTDSGIRFSGSGTFDFDSTLNVTGGNLVVTNAAQIGTNITGQSMQLTHTATNMTIWHKGDTTSNLVAQWFGNQRATPTDGDEAYFSFYLDDSLGNTTEFARQTWIAPDVTSTADAGGLQFELKQNNTLRDYLHMAATAGADTGTIVFNEDSQDIDFRIEGATSVNLFTADAGQDNITINGAAVSANYDVGLIGDGVLMMVETTTPTADTNYGKIYTKNDNKLYFQDGAGTESALAAGGASLSVVDTEVFNGTSPTSFTDLDLSAVVGTNSAFVILRIESATDMNATAVRQNGDTADYYDNASESSAYGTQLAHHDSTAALVLMCTTDTSGVIEWITESAQTATVDVIGYIA